MSSHEASPAPATAANLFPASSDSFPVGMGTPALPLMTSRAESVTPAVTQIQNQTVPLVTPAAIPRDFSAHPGYCNSQQTGGQPFQPGRTQLMQSQVIEKYNAKHFISYSTHAVSSVDRKSNNSKVYHFH